MKNTPKTLEDYKVLVAEYEGDATTTASLARAIQQWEFLLSFPNHRCGNKSIPKTRNWLKRDLGIEVSTPKVKEVVEPISTTHVISFLGTRYGENAPTKLSPTKPWSDEFLPLLELRTKCCVYWDNDMLVDVNLHSKLDFTVPSWMTHDKFNEITMCFFLHAGGSLEWSETAYNRLNQLSFGARYAVCKLVKSNPRTDKRKELKKIFLAWLEGADCLGRYDISNICDQYTMLDAKRAETAAYYDR